MTYEEIEQLLRTNNHSSTIERLRSAVGEEADALGSGVLTPKNFDVRLDHARSFYAEDITRWTDSDQPPDPYVMTGHRERYAKSWAFAQIIKRLCTEDNNEDDEDTDDNDVGPDRAMARICEANAEIATRCVDLITSLEGHVLSLRPMDALSLNRIRDALDSAGVPIVNATGNRKLEIWERVEVALNGVAQTEKEQ